MSSAHGLKYNIEPLTGENFHNWKFRMQIILAENGSLEYITIETNINSLDANARATFSKNDNKAKSLIIQCVADSILECLRDKTTAYYMWKTLEEKFEKKGLPGQLYLKKKLLQMKLKEGESLQKFIKR